MENTMEKLSKLENDAKELEQSIAVIEAQIAVAVESDKFLNIPIDVVWFRKAQFAMQMMKNNLGVMHGQIKELNGILVKEVKIGQQKEFEKCFVDAARVVLTEEQFDDLKLKAMRLVKGE